MSRRVTRAPIATPAALYFMAAMITAAFAVSPTSSWAQPQAPYDPAVALQTLELPPGPRSFCPSTTALSRHPNSLALMSW
ncbi:MAG: hypothetical protein IPL79_17080 [Myxococcales bacterium]|nr:hypothetical protein [Myxococcales bacterium]